MLQEKASPILEEQSRYSQRAWAGGRAKGGGSCRAGAQWPPSSLECIQKWEAEARLKHALGGRERLRMIGRSLSTAPSDGGFYMELTGSIHWAGKRKCRWWPLPSIVGIWKLPWAFISGRVYPVRATHNLLPCLSIWRRDIFLSSMLGYHLTVLRLPRGEEVKL